VEAPLALGDMEETTRFSVFAVDCDADVILGFDWLRAHDLTTRIKSVSAPNAVACRVGGSVRISFFQGLLPRMPRRCFAATSCFSCSALPAWPSPTRYLARHGGVDPRQAASPPTQPTWRRPPRMPGPPTP
jgi:hypothetical protein